MKVEDDYLQLHGNLPPGTGFLPRETSGGRKRLKDDISAQRLEIGDRPARKMAAKTAFVLEGFNIRVSEDWVVADAVEQNRSRPASPLLFPVI